MKQNELTAYWIRHTHLFRYDEYECSNCHKKSDRPYINCPNCGAYMTKEKYDPSWADEAEVMDILI